MKIVTTVCEGKKLLDPNNPPISADYNGETYYFCEQVCLDDFKKDPERFLVEHKPAPPVISID